MQSKEATTPNQTKRISLKDLKQRESDTAQRNLTVRSGVRAGGGTGTLGKFAKYAGR